MSFAEPLCFLASPVLYRPPPAGAFSALIYGHAGIEPGPCVSGMEAFCIVTMLTPQPFTVFPWN